MVDGMVVERWAQLRFYYYQGQGTTSTTTKGRELLLPLPRAGNLNQAKAAIHAMPQLGSTGREPKGVQRHTDTCHGAEWVVVFFFPVALRAWRSVQYALNRTTKKGIFLYLVSILTLADTRQDQVDRVAQLGSQLLSPRF